jgi:hypothetical protein
METQLIYIYVGSSGVIGNNIIKFHLFYTIICCHDNFRRFLHCDLIRILLVMTMIVNNNNNENYFDSK